MTENKSSIKERMIQYIGSKGLSMYEFYKRTSISKGVLTMNGGISEVNIERFLSYDPKVSVLWLIKGEGEMYGDDSIQSTSIVNEPKPVFITSSGYESIEDLAALLKSLESSNKLQSDTIATMKRALNKLKNQ